MRQVPAITIILLLLCWWPVQAGAAVPGAEWQRLASPGAAGWNVASLETACEVADDIGTEALLVVHRGKVVWQCGDTSQPLRVRSMRKSMINALVGLLVADGKLSLDDTLADLGIDDRTPLTDVERSATVRDLLMSRSGIYLPAVNATNDDERPPRGTHRPGEHWFYNNWDFNVLGTIVEKVGGASVFEQFRDRIAKPLQMQDFRVSNMFYDAEPFTLHPAYDFRMSARDLARFGLLYANGGTWGDRRILPAQWIEESFHPHSMNGPEEQDYGYLWWSQVPINGMDERPIVARGWGFQWIWLFPRNELVIVHQTDYWLLPVQDWLGLLPEPEEAYRMLDAVIDARPGVAAQP